MAERTGKGPRGVAPKRDSQRRRRNKPASYGAADPTTGRSAAARPGLGIVDPEPMIQDLWDALQTSAESRFYSEADWQRVRMELAYGNGLLGGEKIAAQAWKTFQDALTELLVSPAAKRRAGIELKPPKDEHEAQADAKILDIASKLQA